MSKLVVILSKSPEASLPAQFSDFLKKHFPQTSVHKQEYEQVVPREAVVFAEQYIPLPDFEDRAKAVARAGNDVFVLSEGLGYSTANLRSEGSRLPDDPRPGRLYGLAGVVYKMRDEPFLAFTKEGSLGSANEILSPYLIK